MKLGIHSFFRSSLQKVGKSLWCIPWFPWSHLSEKLAWFDPFDAMPKEPIEVVWSSKSSSKWRTLCGNVVCLLYVLSFLENPMAYQIYPFPSDSPAIDNAKKITSSIVGWRPISASQGATSWWWGFPARKMGVPQVRWMVYVRENVNLKWMMTYDD